MTWVPQLKATSASDPWAHRKGEPRPLALLWTIYLLISTFVTIFAAFDSFQPPTQSQFIYACRALFVMLAVGSTVLWPMVRLSQQFPRRPVKSIAGDLAVILTPAWLVLLPSPLMTRWSIEIAVALGTSISAWTVLSGAIVLAAYRTPSHTARTLWTIGIIALLVAAPLGVVVLRAPTDWLWLSPFTAVFQITNAEPALAPAMTSGEWMLTIAPLALGIPVLLGAMALPARSAARPPAPASLH